MRKAILNKESEFVVKEEKILVYVMSFLFFALFLYGMIDAILLNFQKVNYQSFIFMIALVPAIYLFQKGYRNNIYIRINKTGVFQNEQIVTNWKDFLNAFVTQKKKMITIQDNFILVIEYLKEGNDKGFRRKIPLTNTQNKSEEEVLDAIKFFWKLYKTSVYI